MLHPASNKKSITSGQPGQIAVIILLIMGVLVVLVLSFASRTAQEVQLSGQEQDSTRVFNAAETGVEQALSDSDYFATADSIGSTGDLPVTNAPDNTTATFNITRQDGLQTRITQGSSATVFLDQFPVNNLYFDLNWAKEAACNQRASIIVAVYYEDPVGVNKVFYDAMKPNCNPSDGTYDSNKAIGFRTQGVDPINGDYEQRTRIDLTSLMGKKKTMARIKALYADADISITTSGITAQAYEIRSEARDTTDPTGGEKSAIRVTRTRPAPPVIFDYSLYSGGSLDK